MIVQNGTVKTESFVKAVGKMPFTGKHKVRYCYAEGIRAAHRGQEKLKHRYERDLGRIAVANSLMGLVGFVIAGLAVKFGVDEESWQFAAEAAGGSLLAAGHTVSAVANLIIRNQLQARPVSAEPALPPRPVVIIGPNLPTLTEKVVTHGAALATCLGPVVHVALYQQFNS